MLAATLAARAREIREELAVCDGYLDDVGEKETTARVLAYVQHLLPVVQGVDNLEDVPVYRQPRFALPVEGAKAVYTPSLRLLWLFWLRRLVLRVTTASEGVTVKEYRAVVALVDASGQIRGRLGPVELVKDRRVRAAFDGVDRAQWWAGARLDLRWLYTAAMLRRLELPAKKLRNYWAGLYYEVTASDRRGYAREAALAAFARFSIAETTEVVARNVAWYTQYLPRGEREDALRCLSMPKGEVPNKQMPREMPQKPARIDKLYQAPPMPPPLDFTLVD